MWINSKIQVLRRDKWIEIKKKMVEKVIEKKIFM
jgi:hypothetical protein